MTNDIQELALIEAKERWPEAREALDWLFLRCRVREPNEDEMNWARKAAEAIYASSKQDS
jgi:hypothetical protein